MISIFVLNVSVSVLVFVVLYYISNFRITPATAFYLSCKKQSPRREKIIATSGEWSFHYAYSVLGGRFNLGEAAIAQSAYWAYLYAECVLRRRFTLGEASIAQDGTYSYYYAVDILQRRFPLGESKILSSRYAERYIKRFKIEQEKLDWQKVGF